MTQGITDLVTYNTTSANADQRLRGVLETYLHYLRHHETTRTVVIDQGSARPFYYNLYAYLHNEGYDPNIHWLILNLSNLKGPEDFTPATETLVIPDLGLVEEIIRMANG